MTADTILQRLDRVRATGPGRWLACCPAHDDFSPSLSVREGDDGRVLLHCFSGCGAHDVLRAVGATWRDVFPERPTWQNHRSRKAPPVPYRDVLLALRHEAIVVLLIADAATRGALDRELAARLTLAVSRIETATRIADGQRH